jgi:uncharacterized protein (TIGR03086 family)
MDGDGETTTAPSDPRTAGHRPAGPPAGLIREAACGEVRGSTHVPTLSGLVVGVRSSGLAAGVRSSGLAAGVVEQDVGMVDTEALDDVLRTTEQILGGVHPDQFGLPTPCPDYDVGTLVNHIVAWVNVFADAASGQQPHIDPASFTAGPDPAAEFTASAQRLSAAFHDGAAERPIDLGNGPSPGSMIFGVVLMEYIGHGWDLAMATDQPAPYSERSISAAKEAAQASLKPEYRGPDKSFGDIVSVPDEAPPLDQLIGLLGREPRT